MPEQKDHPRQKTLEELRADLKRLNGNAVKIAVEIITLQRLIAEQEEIADEVRPSADGDGRKGR